MGGLISVESKMTYEDMKRYMWFHMLKRGKGIRPGLIVNIALTGFLLILFAAAILLFGFPFLDRFWLLGFVLVVFWVMYFCIVPLTTKRIYKTSKVHSESGQRFTFSADGVQIETKGASVSGSSMYRYDAFHKAFEVKDAFYLYINANQAHLVSKRGMDEGTATGIRGILFEKLGKKFMSCI